MTSVSKYIWGFNAVALGVWEAAAFFSSGRVPTITRTCGNFHQRQPHLAKPIICLWLIGVGRHLLSESKGSPREGSPQKRRAV